MIQDIYPSKLDNSYKNFEMRDKDVLLVFDEKGRILIREKDGKIEFPVASEIECVENVYLFLVDDRRFFLAMDSIDGKIDNSANDSIATSEENTDNYLKHYSIRELRDHFSGEESTKKYLFAAFTAYHLWKWYSDSRFCGKCGSKTKPGDTERSMCCPVCGNVIYPRINPAVIVGVTKGDSLLITRYRSGYKHNALVAGFTEIGETLEGTVAREVMEETGVRVKNIRYYKSQPWGMAQDVLVGFFCEADGDGTIHMDENELKYAEWVRREDIVLQPNNLSLTNEMMRVFKDGNAVL